MVKRSWIQLFAAVSVSFVCVGTLWCRAATGEDSSAVVPEENLAEEFRGKTVMLEVNRSSVLESKSGSVVITEARFRKLGDRYFILGTGYGAEDDPDWWYKDMLVGVPWESVIRFHAMTTEQFDQYMLR